MSPRPPKIRLGSAFPLHSHPRSLQGTLDTYQLCEQLGAGGMAVVYRALDSRNRPVAIKVLFDRFLASPSSRDCLEQEAALLARIQHPNVARLRDVIQMENRAEPRALVLRLAPGRSLERVLTDTRPLTTLELSTLALQLIEAVYAVHSAGVLHCDLKPGNIVFQRGRVPHATLVDFGIGQADHQALGPSPASYSGTGPYMSPEQLTGDALTPKTDIYGLGQLIAEAIMRKPVFEGSFPRVARQKLMGPPEQLDLPEAARPLEPILRACLVTDPKLRPSLKTLARSVRAGLARMAAHQRSATKPRMFFRGAWASQPYS